MLGFYFNYNFNNEQGMPHIKVTDHNEEVQKIQTSDKKKVICKVDKFDEELYERCIKSKSYIDVDIKDLTLPKPMFKFQEREMNEKRKFEDEYYNNYVTISIKKEVKNVKNQNKKKLTKYYNKARPRVYKNKEFIINDAVLTKLPEKIENLLFGNLLKYKPDDKDTKNLLLKPKNSGFKITSNIRNQFDDFNSNIPIVRIFLIS